MQVQLAGLVTGLGLVRFFVAGQLPFTVHKTRKVGKRLEDIVIPILRCYDRHTKSSIQDTRF